MRFTFWCIFLSSFCSANVKWPNYKLCGKHGGNDNNLSVCSFFYFIAVDCNLLPKHFSRLRKFHNLPLPLGLFISFQVSCPSAIWEFCNFAPRLGNDCFALCSQHFWWYDVIYFRLQSFRRQWIVKFHPGLNSYYHPPQQYSSIYPKTLDPYSFVRFLPAGPTAQSWSHIFCTLAQEYIDYFKSVKLKRTSTILTTLSWGSGVWIINILL